MDPTSQVNKQQEVWGNYLLDILNRVNDQFINITYRTDLEQGTKASILSSYSRAVEAVMLGGRLPITGSPTVPPQVPVFNLESAPTKDFPERLG